MIDGGCGAHAAPRLQFRPVVALHEQAHVSGPFLLPLRVVDTAIIHDLQSKPRIRDRLGDGELDPHSLHLKKMVERHALVG
jgi:hypothetical protein